MFLLTTRLVSGTSIEDGEDERESIASALDMADQEKVNEQQQRNKAHSDMCL